jgi:DNA polymerase Ligase (LigD)
MLPNFRGVRGMPRFVILEHDHPERHWDLMLETGEVLRTWRLSAPPAEGREAAIQSSFDHRLVYLTYEGPISGNRGTVLRWDEGEFEWLRQDADEIVVSLTGRRLSGLLRLRLTGDNGLARFESRS